MTGMDTPDQVLPLRNSACQAEASAKAGGSAWKRPICVTLH